MKIRAAIAPVMAVLLAACATPGGRTSCPAGLSAVTTAELFFGRNIGGALGVSDDDWRRFVDEEVTPRFPDGLTVIDAAGQWRGADGAIAREPSKVLLLVLSGAAGEDEKIDAVRQAYRARFRQESVLLLRRQGCAAF